MSHILIIFRCYGIGLNCHPTLNLAHEPGYMSVNESSLIETVLFMCMLAIITVHIQPACWGNCFNHFSKPMSHQGFICLNLAGVRQALWLTKTKLISSLPPQLLSLADSPAHQIPDQNERVQNAIKHARFWDTTRERPGKEIYR